MALLGHDMAVAWDSQLLSYCYINAHELCRFTCTIGTLKASRQYGPIFQRGDLAEISDVIVYFAFNTGAAGELQLVQQATEARGANGKLQA